MHTFLHNLSTGFWAFLIGFFILCALLWLLLKFVAPFLNELLNSIKTLEKSRPRDVVITIVVIIALLLGMTYCGSLINGYPNDDKTAQSVTAESQPQSEPPRPHAETFSVCVFCSASSDVEPKYTAAAEKLGAALAERKWTLLWGGSENGLMGAVARGAKQNGGRAVGIITKQDYSWGGIAKNADELLAFDTVPERKHALQTRASAFIVLPGGLGTLDEFADTLEQKAIAEPGAPPAAKPIIIFNQDGYYDALLAFLKNGETKKFISASAKQNYTVVTNIEDLLAELDKAERQLTRRNNTEP